MKRFTINFVIGILLIRMSIGCATIIHGSTQDIDIASNPDNAEVWINGARMANTPTRVTLKRNTTHNIRIVKDEYRETTVRIDNEVSTWILGNIVFGGIIGCGVDFISGGAYELSPERLDVNLTRLEAMDGRTINIPQRKLDNIKQIRFIDDNGNESLVVNINWSE